MGGGVGGEGRNKNGTSPSPATKSEEKRMFSQAKGLKG